MGTFDDLSSELRRKKHKAARARRYYLKNRTKLLARSTAWNKANKERRNALRRKS